MGTETIQNIDAWEPEIKVEHKHENGIERELIKNFDAENALKELGTEVTRISHEVIPKFDPE